MEQGDHCKMDDSASDMDSVHTLFEFVS